MHRDNPYAPIPGVDRARGAMLGLACGDAVGTTVEGRRPGRFEPVEDMVGGGPFLLEPGQWTDDTAMALCLAESLIERDGFNASDQMQRYVRWHRQGHLSSTDRFVDIGNTVMGALGRFEVTGDPYAGSTDPMTATNGSLVRVAPVAIFFAADPVAAVARAADSSRTTHGAPEAVDACRYLTALLVGALWGIPKSVLLSDRFTPVPGLWDEFPLCEEVDEVACGTYRDREPPEIEGVSSAAGTLEAALWAFHRTDDFREGCLRVVNLGLDSDSTGAVYGQLAGACLGQHAIPGEWRMRLAKRGVIEHYADGLHAAWVHAAGPGAR